MRLEWLPEYLLRRVPQSVVERLITLMMWLRSCGTSDLSTPLLKKFRCFPGEVASKYALRERMMENMWRDVGIRRLPMWLREFESSAARKNGSSTWHPSNDWMSGVDRFYEPRRTCINRQTLRESWGRVFQLVWPQGKPEFRVESLEAASHSFEGRTGFGWPFMTSKLEAFDECLEQSRILIRDGGTSYLPEYPYVLGVRGQAAELGAPAKYRCIFQGPRVVANLEKMLFLPIFRQLQQNPVFCAWAGLRQTDYKVAELLRIGDPVLSIDFSNFDATIPARILRAAFEILFDNGKGRDYQAIRTMVINHFIGGDLITPTGMRYGRSRGIPSGSVLTNSVGGVANLLAVEYGARSQGLTIADAAVQGDDGVYRFRPLAGSRQTMFDKDMFCRTLQTELGMTIHPDKQYYANNECHFLQRVHRYSYEGGVGIRSLSRTLVGMGNYDRFRKGWNGGMDTIRWLQQVEGASNHPLFEDFCAWWAAYDENAFLSWDQLIAKAGGMDHVKEVFGSRQEFEQKVPVESLPLGRTARILWELKVRGF